MLKNNSRDVVLKIPIGDVISELEGGMETANKCGDICACVYYATKINALNDVVDGLVSVDKDTEGLISEVTIR